MHTSVRSNLDPVWQVLITRLNDYKKGLFKKYIVSDTNLLLDSRGEKLIPILGKSPKTKKLLQISINQDNCFVTETDS